MCLYILCGVYIVLAIILNDIFRCVCPFFSPSSPSQSCINESSHCWSLQHHQLPPPLPHVGHSRQAHPLSPCWGIPCFILVFLPICSRKHIPFSAPSGDSWLALISQVHCTLPQLRTGQGMWWARGVCEADTASQMLRESHFQGTISWSFGQDTSLLKGVYYLIGRWTCVHEKTINSKSERILNSK